MASSGDDTSRLHREENCVRRVLPQARQTATEGFFFGGMAPRAWQANGSPCHVTQPCYDAEMLQLLLPAAG